MKLYFGTGLTQGGIVSPSSLCLLRLPSSPASSSIFPFANVVCVRVVSLLWCWFVRAFGLRSLFVLGLVRLHCDYLKKLIPIDLPLFPLPLFLLCLCTGSR